VPKLERLEDVVRSRASFKAHPIHPALIPFPFAFLEGAALFDLAGSAFRHSPFWSTASHLTVAGVASGLLAAIPGIIDYLYTIPPASSGKRRARTHGIGNVLVLAMFSAAWLLRADGGSPSVATLLLEILGGGLLCYTGLLGGTLVTRNMAGVDHRYASAGKWSEESIAARPGETVVVADAAELKESQMKLLRVNGRRIALARTAEGYVAFDDRCTHRGGSLAGGVLVDGVVQCLWHGSQFDVATGKARCGPADEPVTVYRVEEKRGKVWLVWPPE
jgi:nitrite reductase/ring-hydroxylating ferredoxin subunit/uncharacterized membrane protein